MHEELPAPDRAALERLCRYIARPPLGARPPALQDAGARAFAYRLHPPLSEDRLHRLPAGRYAVRLKTPYSDG